MTSQKLSVTETDSPKFLSPRPLRPGDRVAVVAPSSAFDRTAFEAGLARLRERYEVVLGSSIFETSPASSPSRFAGSDEQRFRDLEHALTAPDIRAVFCARGGYGAMRLLPALASLELPESPKFLAGFSDITALHLFFQAHGWVSLHAPVVTQLSRLPEDNASALWEALENPDRPRTLSGRGLGNGRIQGPLIGGNLTVLTSLLGTPFMPSLKGAVLFLEDVGELPYRIDRMMAHLALSGVLSEVSGVALGEFTNCGETGEQAALSAIAAHRLPCVFGLPAGHGGENYPLFLGREAILDADNGTLEEI